jgi:hypothetical protein
VARGWRRVDRLVDAEHEQRRHAGRYLQLHTARTAWSSSAAGSVPRPAPH